MRKYVVVSGLAGLFAPFFFEFAWHFLREDFGSWSVVVFWPGSVFLADPGRSANARFGYLALSIAANGAFYSVVGLVFWGIMHKSRWFLLVFILPVMWFCYRVFVLVNS